MPSNNYNANFLRTTLMNEIRYDEYRQGDIKLIEELDPLSPEIHEFISDLSVFADYTYIGEQLTTVCNRYHGCTTTVWIVLMVNGLMSRTDLRVGMVLKIPTYDNLIYVINRRNIRRVTDVNKFGTRILT